VLRLLSRDTRGDIPNPGLFEFILCHLVATNIVLELWNVVSMCNYAPMHSYRMQGDVDLAIYLFENILSLTVLKVEHKDLFMVW
jgi:hypothetical protein